MKNFNFQKIILCGLFFISQAIFANNDALEITPLATLPSSILPGHTTTAYYVVKKISTDASKSYTVSLPKNVTQITNNTAFQNTCKSNFNLIYPYDCILQLKITGAVNSSDSNNKNKIGICNSSGCQYISKENSLNVTVGEKNNLASVAIVNENNEPTAYTTNDGGISWSYHSISAIGRNNESVTCKGKDNQHCVAIADNHASNPPFVFSSYVSDDGGKTWATYTIDTGVGLSSSLSSISCSNNGMNCVAVGTIVQPPSSKVPDYVYIPTAYTTSNGGVSWSKEEVPNEGSSTWLQSVKCSDDKNLNCIATGKFMGTEGDYTHVGFVVYKSNDGGKNWDDHILDSYDGSLGTSNLNEAICTGDKNDKCIAVGSIGKGENQKPVVFTSIDGGNTWSKQFLSGFDNVNGILKSVRCDFNNKLACIAVGKETTTVDFPLVAESSDGGLTWNTILDFDSYGFQDFNSIRCSNTKNNNCYIIGYSAGICDNNGCDNDLKTGLIYNALYENNQWQYGKYNRKNAFANEGSPDHYLTTTDTEIAITG